MARKKRPEKRRRATRGVASLEEAREWLPARSIEDIECVVPDQAGVGRGKMMPVAEVPRRADDVDAGLDLHPDDRRRLAGGRRAASRTTPPTATCCSSRTSRRCRRAVGDGSDRAAHPRRLPRATGGRSRSRRARCCAASSSSTRNRGWRPVVAPEIEFYLVKPNTDPDYPLEPPTGRSGRPESARQSYSIAAVNEFDELFDDIYDFSEAQELEIDTLIHEEGAAQMEINLRHGDPLVLADQVFHVQAHDPRGGAPPRHVRDLHGQADVARAGLGDAHPPVGGRHRDRQRTSSPTRPATRRRSSSPSSAARRNTCRRSPACWRPTSTRTAG